VRWLITMVMVAGATAESVGDERLVSGRVTVSGSELAFVLVYDVEAAAGHKSFLTLGHTLPQGTAIVGAEISGRGFVQRLGRMESHVATALADAVLSHEASDRESQRGFIHISSSAHRYEIAVAVPAASDGRLRLVLEGRLPTCRYRGKTWVAVTDELVTGFVTIVEHRRDTRPRERADRGL
jgi:hypothetical protein